MAIRNAVKVTLLSLDDEEPLSYPAQSAFVFEPQAPKPEAVAAPVSNDTMPPPPPTPVRVPEPAKEISPAAAWHARADTLRAMTDTLPSGITRALMPKIVALYDALAREEGWSEQEKPAPTPEESLTEQTPPEDEEPADIVLSPPSRTPEWRALPRRPELLGRRIARRRG